MPPNRFDGVAVFSSASCGMTVDEVDVQSEHVEAAVPVAVRLVAPDHRYRRGLAVT